MIFRPVESKWYGFEADGQTLCVGPLPGVKRVAMYIVKENVIEVLAYFKSEARAKAALDAITKLAKGVFEG